MKQPSPQHLMIRDLISKFPDAPTRTIAKIAFESCPSGFTSYDSARTMVRYIRGQQSAERTALISDKSQVKDGRTGDPFGSLPEPKSEWDAPWCAYELELPAKILMLSDIHIPYHDPVLRVALEHGKDRGCDTIMLNGDTADFFSISAWEKDPTRRNLKNELESVKQFLSVLRQAFPNARIIWKNGNHEDRWERYLFVKAPELVGITDFEMDSVLKLADVGCTFVKEMRPIKAGKLYVLHGHEYRFNISNPVNPARGFFLRAKTHCIGGHLHRSSQHSENSLDNTVISTWSTGCLCQLHPRYSPINSWNHGFAVVEVDASGAFTVDNKRIIDGKVW